MIRARLPDPPEHTTMLAALEITCPNCGQRHPHNAEELGRIDRCLICGHPFDVAPGEEASASDSASLLQPGLIEHLSLQREHAPGDQPKSSQLQDAVTEAATCRVGRNFDNSQERDLDQRDPEAESLFQSLVQAQEDLCSSLTELVRLRLTAEPTDGGSQGVVLRGGEPERILEDSGSQPAYNEDRLPSDGGSGFEDEAIVQGLMALRDELDRLRRESQHTQSELKAARDSTARIIELEHSLVRCREECDTLRAELQGQVQKQETQSGRATNPLRERAAAIDHSEADTKHLDHLPLGGRDANGALPAEAAPQLEALTIQLHESRSANQRLRSLL